MDYSLEEGKIDVELIKQGQYYYPANLLNRRQVKIDNFQNKEYSTVVLSF
jgi:hypothetical protein